MGEHVNILSAGRRYKGVVTRDLRDVDEQSLMLANMFPATTPLLDRNDSRKPEQGVGAESARRSARAGDRDRRRLAARSVAEPPRPRAHRPSRRQSQPRARLRLRQSRMGTRRAGVDADAHSRLARHADGLTVAPHRGHPARGAPRSNARRRATHRRRAESSRRWRSRRRSSRGECSRRSRRTSASCG